MSEKLTYEEVVIYRKKEIKRGNNKTRNKGAGNTPAHASLIYESNTSTGPVALPSTIE